MEGKGQHGEVVGTDNHWVDLRLRQTLSGVVPCTIEGLEIEHLPPEQTGPAGNWLSSRLPHRVLFIVSAWLCSSPFPFFSFSLWIFS